MAEKLEGDAIADAGGPAFPSTLVNEREGVCERFTGMTLRDWFAGQALAGMGGLQLPYEEAARVSYEYADALLQERAKRG